MVFRVLAHLSDLHLGRSAETARRARALCRALLARNVDHVVVSGDVTHRGRRSELAQFERLFAPFLARGRLTVVPGNHDCLGDDVSTALRGGGRVEVVEAPDLYLVRFDSTGPHNRQLGDQKGLMTEEDAARIVEAFESAPAGTLAVLLLHHHLLWLPHDNRFERVLSFLGWSAAEELERGAELVSALRGRCDLVLHGHRHNPGMATLFADEDRPLTVLNAGSSTEIGSMRLFVHGKGRLAAPPVWVSGEALAVPPVRERLYRAPFPGA